MIKREETKAAARGKRVLKLSHYPRHRSQLSEIATSYSISKSLAWQLVLAYTNNIYSLRKKLKRYYPEDGIEDASTVWTEFDADATRMIEALLKEKEFNYTELAKQAINDFYLKLINKAIDHKNQCFQTYLPEFHAK